MSLVASATSTYYPVTVSAPYAGAAQTICQNGASPATSVTYSVCGTVGAVGTLTVSATWYLGGTLVYTDPTSHSITGTTGSIILPAGAIPYTTFGSFTGANGLYCKLSWTGASPVPCGSTTSVSGTPTNVTVNQAPTAILGTNHVCTGNTSTLSDNVAAGIWSSSSSTIASVVFNTGVVTGNVAGVVHITYTLGSGCTTNTTFTVNQTPANITGLLSVCTGTLSTVSDVTAGGIWTSSNTSVASIGSGTGTTGDIQGLTAGVTTISYSLATGCLATTSVTVNQSPSAISGATTVCSGDSITLSDISAGGVWTSSSAAIATVNFSTGVVKGVAASGTFRISYELTSGCYTTTGLMTVNPLPAAIMGVASVCIGGLTSLSDATAGGFWSASNSDVTVGSGSGFVTGLGGATAGLDTITFSVSTGCLRTVVVTVNPLPAAISGVDSVCKGSTTSLSDIGGGTWSSSAILVATIASTGVATGVASGVSTITYKLSTGCLRTTQLTVNALPTAILGPSSLCVGSTTTLSDLTPNGTWSSSNAGVASIGSSTGIVGGAAAGTSTIIFKLSVTGCSTSKTMSVDATPVAISGATSVCIGTSTGLSDATVGGTWSSNNTAVATISAAGVVTGVSFGVATISYKVSTGCFATSTITVNTNPSAITGTTHVCAGSTTALTDLSTLGTWSSSNTAVAVFVDAFGDIQGVSAGTTTISYTIATGCAASVILTVHALPAAISGASAVCVGSTLSLSDGTAGGTWTSGTTANATIGSTSGVLTGVAQGTDIVNYTITSTGCVSSKTVTINPLPTAITGSQAVCTGSLTSLSDGTPGGTWSSSNTAKALVDGSGNVTGVAAGTSSITYMLGTGCLAKTSVTVNALPGTINGLTSVCVGSNISLSDATTGGTWSSSNTAVATISSAGIVTGQASGVLVVTYTLGTGCFNTTSLTVNEVPTIIAGTESVCVGSTTSLSNGVSGGIWSSGTTAVAIIGISSGLVTGSAAGTTTIAYVLGTGCKATAIVTVDALPAVITGPTNVCIGAIITLNDITAGGAWSSSNTSIAPIGAGSGIITGEAAGTATMTYSLATGCIRTIAVNVNPLPVGIVGSPAVCVSATTALTDPTPGGVWTSSVTSNAIVGTSSGIVTGVNAGTTNITYTLSTGCDTMITMTVNPLPGVISGPTSVCQGQTITLSDGAFVGSWMSGNTSVATVGSGTGVVTGVAAGTATVTFMLSATGCFKTVNITVRQLPSPITGDSIICQTPTSGLADVTPGGVWTSGNTTVAVINASTGLITPGAAGTVTITYSLGGCYNTKSVTVNPNPSVISGASSVCSGSSTTLSDATLGGSWSSSNPSIASIGSGTGVVNGVLTGSVTISYLLNTGCVATLPFSVGALPASITGTTYLCIGTTTLLHDATVGGTWHSGDITVTIPSPGSGTVQGVSAGTATISYIPASGCITTTIVTVNSNPAPITGRLNACVGDTTQLGDAMTGGEWTSSHPTIAATGTLNGIMTGVSVGSSTITYTLGSGCYTTAQLTINATPAPITGLSNVCEGSGITLSDASPGGIWSSAETVVAQIGSLTGNVIGQSITGPDTIYYTLGGMCSVYKVINVNVTPDSIAGVLNLCSGYTASLSDGVAGGTWTSSNTAIATVGLSTGIVTGITGGTVRISYTLGSGCATSTPDTINTTPSVILGPTNVCPQLTITLSDAALNGVWSSNNLSVASVVDSTGVVTGQNGGSAVISYIISTTGCGVATTINVNPAPPAISGALGVCIGSHTSLSDIAGGGIWTSSNTTIAPVGETTGVVSGINLGTAIITYELLSTGCLATGVATVNPNPAPISGIKNVCTGATITLSDATLFGSWTSSNTSVATIGAVTGIVNGIDSGYATITYTLGTGCFATDLIRGNLSPVAISGDTTLCVGSMIIVSDMTTFGSWTSSNTSTATINAATGMITGVSAGTVIITYILGTGCLAQLGVTVNPIPAPISGPAIVCDSSHIFLNDSTAGGAWSMTNTTFGTVDVSGDVTGITPGNDTVVYTLATGCFTTHFLTVSAVPAPIVGSDIVCSGSVDTLTSAPAGGIWSSSGTGIATVGSGTGYVLGRSAGLAIITYTSLSGCIAVSYVTVNPVPDSIVGVDNLCPGFATTLFDTTGWGIWSSSSNTASATITFTGSTATVTAILAASTTTISYTISNGCAATLVFTVEPLPYVGSITGNEVFCMGTTSALGDSVAGGVWSSSNTSVVSVGSTGIATGVSVGTATISYVVTEQCGMDTATALIQISPLPFAPPISGANELCLHSTTTLSDGTLGGVWTSNDTNTATINSVSGSIYASNPGITTISYTYTNSCGSYTASEVVTVDATFIFGRIVTFPDTPMCSKTLYQNFGAMLPAPAGIVYNWSVTPGDSLVAVGALGQYAIVSFNTPGRAVVTLSAEIINSGCVIADSFVTTIGSSVAADPGVQYYLNEFACTDNTPDSYQWGYDDIITLDSTILVGEISQTYYNPHPDTLSKNYWVITTKNGCSQKSYYTFSTTTGLANVNTNATEVLLFPNPADSKVNIVVKGLNGSGTTEVKLLDMFGKEIETTNLVNGRGVFDVSELPAAVYSVLIFDNNTKIGSKIFVKN